MQLKSVHIEDFRVIRKADIGMDSKLTVLVGENGTGKTTVATALSRLFQSIDSGLSLRLQSNDYPYGEPGQPSIRATLEFTQEEVENQLIPSLLPQGFSEWSERQLAEWLRRCGTEAHFSLTGETGHRVTLMQWGDLYLGANQIAKKPISFNERGSCGSWSDVAVPASQGKRVVFKADELLKERPSILDEHPPAGFMPRLKDYILARFKLVPEFRTRATPKISTDAMESLAGSDTAVALYNLMANRDQHHRDRYKVIKQVFNSLFPRFNIEAVEETPGSHIPHILFYEEGRPNPVSLDMMSAGVHETLSFITNLVARDGLIFFVDHPEEHLHPHSMRFIHKLLRNSSENNQIIVATHSPYFVDPEHPNTLRRFSIGKNGARVYQPELNELRASQLAQISKDLTPVGNREVVFAKAVVLVEEETVTGFLTEVAPKLGFNIEAAGVSIIGVDGDGGFERFRPLLDGLGIPNVNFRDRSWGINPKYPPDRYFSLSSDSFEQYMDDNGLRELRLKAKGTVGRAKARVGAELGKRIKPKDIPPLFCDVLDAATRLAQAGSGI